MANVKIHEVHDLYNELQKNGDTLRETMIQLRGSIEDLSDIDSFSGKGATAAKNYLKDIHMKVSLAYQDTIDIFKENLKTSIDCFHSEVDSDESCIIKSSYISNFKTEIKTNKDKMKDAAKEINQAIKSINDITSADSINVSSLTESYNTTKEVVSKLEKSLNTYFSSQSGSLSELGDALSNLQKAQQQMDSISSGNGGITSYNSSLKSEVLGGLYEVKKYRKLYKKAIKYGRAGYYTLFRLCAKGSKYTKFIMKKGKLAAILGLKPLKDWSKNNKYRILQYNNGYITKEGKEIFKKLGCVEGDPQFLFNYAGKNCKGITKAVGKAAQNGAKNSFKLFSFKGFSSLSKVGKALKVGSGALAIASTGLSVYDNYNEARKDGLSKEKSIASTAIGTAGDLAVAGASAEVGMAIGTAFGGPVGAIAGLMAGAAVGYFGSKIMSGVKKGVNYVLKNGVKGTVKNIKNAVSKKVSSLGHWIFGN